MKTKRKKWHQRKALYLFSVKQSFEDVMIFYLNCLSVFVRKTLMITSTSALSNTRTEALPTHNSQDYSDGRLKEMILHMTSLGLGSDSKPFISIKTAGVGRKPNWCACFNGTCHTPIDSGLNLPTQFHAVSCTTNRVKTVDLKLMA